MSEREFSKISGLPVAIQPIASNTIVEIETADGQSFQAPFSALGGMPSSHGSTHQDGGSDEIGTEFPTANAIPKADDAGQLNDWIADASTSVKGKVQLAANNESAANKAVQSNDTRMSNARMPTAHAASHLGGTDDLGLGSAAFADVGDDVCPLFGGIVPSIYLPSYVDDVIEVANFAALPVTGETGKIYVTLDDNLTYRWTGSAYVEISKSLALGETSSTAYRGDRGKIAYDHSQAAHAPSNADNTQGAINGATTKATPVDADVFGFLDSAASFIMKKMTAANVKAWLKAYFDTLYTGSSGETPASIMSKISVDSTSRVAEYTGDGIPQIPDNVAGRTYFQDAWATTDGWSTAQGTLSAPGGYLRVTTSANPALLIKDIGSSPNAKTLIYRVRGTSGGLVSMRYYNGSTQVAIDSITLDGTWQILKSYLPSGATNNLIYLRIDSVSGSIVDLDVVYIGTGAYDTPALDRSGNGNNLSLTAVTPVNGKYGKEMSFNGSTSYAQASSPVIGTTGTIAIRFKRGSLGIEQGLFSTTNATVNGLGFSFNTSNVLRLVFSNGTTMVGSGTKVFNSTNVFSSVVVNSSGQVFYDGVLSTDTVPTSWVLGLRNLLLGTDATNFFNGIISHFRYDSRIWTADEALAWSVNPGPDDSLSMSENPSAGDVMLWPDGGVSFLRSDNVGSGWATALGANLGTNWATALGAALGTGWTTALASTPSSIFGNLSVLYVEDTTYTDHTYNLPEIPGSSGSCALYIVRSRVGSVNISSYKSPTAHGFSMYFGWYPDVDQTPTAQTMITSFSGVAANTGIYTIAPSTAGADRYLISVLFASRA